MAAGADGQSLRRLTRRSQFLRAARGTRAGRSAFGLRVVPAAETAPGVGFTVTKKVGNAPQRNRIKRRLRAAAAACADDFRPGHDYVLLARREALSLPYARLVADLGGLIARVHAQAPARNTIDPATANGTPDHEI